MPLELDEKNYVDRIFVCDTLSRRNKSDPFLTRFIIGDTKRIFCKNIIGLTTNFTLAIWLDWRNVVYLELLNQDETLDSNKYCTLLDWLKDAIDQKRPKLKEEGVIYHQDNARPHVSLMTQKKSLQFEWDVLPHSSYSPDIAHPTYHLFRCVKSSMKGITFLNIEDCKSYLEFHFSTS